MPVFFVYLIIFIAALAVATVLAPKAPGQKPASLTDFTIPTAEPGRPIPVIFGTVVVTAPNVVWFGDLAQAPVKAGGGK